MDDLDIQRVKQKNEWAEVSGGLAIDLWESEARDRRLEARYAATECGERTTRVADAADGAGRVN